MWNAHELPPRGGRIRQRPEQVERSANTELAPDGTCVAHRGMEGRREKERDAYRLERSFDNRGGRRDIDAKRFVDVRATALARDRPVAVLRHTQSGSRRHECRSR